MHLIRNSLLALLLLSAGPLLADECTPITPPPPHEWLADVNRKPELTDSLIRLRSVRDVEQLRRDIRKVLFGSDALPTGLPASIERVSDQQVLPNPPQELASVDRMIIEMGSAKSVVYLFSPKEPRRQLVIYHAGHDSVLPPAVISRFVQSGYTVAGIYMPVSADNVKYAPIVDLPGIGRMKIVNHNQFPLLETATFNPLRLFIEPVIIVLNQLLLQHRFDSVTMLGFSGGGWTTTIAAAIDPRINTSYAVAGSLPVDVRWADWTSWGDYEQIHPWLLRAASFEEIYLLDASGKGRRHVQVLNKYDTCCFSVPSVPTYVPVVQKRLAAIGPGTYDFILDDTQVKHAVSPCTMTRILGDLAAGTGSARAGLGHDGRQ
jgi:hypothetical protein